MALPKDPFVSVSTWAGIWSFSATGKATRLTTNIMAMVSTASPRVATALCHFCPRGLTQKLLTTANTTVKVSSKGEGFGSK